MLLPWQIYFLSHVKKVQYIFYDDLLNYSKLDSANLFYFALVRWQRMPVMYQSCPAVQERAVSN